MRTLIITVAIGVILASVACESSGHRLSEEECREGSDFIKNAALARENGMDEMTFVSKMVFDFESVKAFPPAWRWFAQDKPDEDFLLAAASDVFEKPENPQLHQREFLRKCLVRQ